MEYPEMASFQDFSQPQKTYDKIKSKMKGPNDTEINSALSIYTYRSIYAGSEDLNNRSVQSMDSSLSIESSRSQMIERLVAERLKLGFVKVTDQLTSGHEADIWDMEEEEESFEEETPSDIKLCHKLSKKKPPILPTVLSDSESLDSNLVFPIAEAVDSDLDSHEDPSKDLLMFMHRRRSTYTPKGYQPATPQFKKIEKQSRLQWTPLTKPSQRYVKFLFEEALAPMNNIKLTEHVDSWSDLGGDKRTLDSSEDDLTISFNLANLMETIDLGDAPPLEEAYTKEFKYTPWWALPDTQSSESVRAIRHIFKSVSNLKVAEIEIKRFLRSQKEKVVEEPIPEGQELSVKSFLVSEDEGYVLKEESCYFLQPKVKAEPIIEVDEPRREMAEYDIQKMHKKSVESLQAHGSTDSLIEYKKKSVRFSKRQLFSAVRMAGAMTTEEEEESDDGGVGKRRESRRASARGSVGKERAASVVAEETTKSEKSKEGKLEEGSEDSLFSEWALPEESGEPLPAEAPEEKIDVTSSSSDSLFDPSEDEIVGRGSVYPVPRDMSFFKSEPPTAKSPSLCYADKRRKLISSFEKEPPLDAPLNNKNVRVVPMRKVNPDGTSVVNEFRFVDKRPEWLLMSRGCREMNPEAKENMIQMYRCLSEKENLPVFEKIAKSFKTRNAHYERLGRVPQGVFKVAGKVLENNTRLRKFNLTGQSMTDDDLYHMCKAMSNMPRLQRLKINYAGLTSDNVKLLANCINLFDDLCVLDLSHNKIGDKGVHQLFAAVETLPTVVNLRLADNQLTADCFDGLKIVFNRDNKISSLDLSWNQINDGTALLNFAKLLKEGETALKELYMSWNGLEGMDAANAFLIFASLRDFFYLDIGFNGFGHLNEIQVFNTMLKESPSLKYLILAGNPLDEGMDYPLLVNLEWDRPATLKLIDLGDHWVLKETLQLCNRYRDRYNLIVKIGNVLDNAEITQPNMKEAFLKRIKYLNSGKGKRKPLNLGLILLKLKKSNEEEFGEMRLSAFRKLLGDNNFLIDDDLDLMLGKAFSKKRRTVDVEEMLQMWLTLYPATKKMLVKKEKRVRRRSKKEETQKKDKEKEAEEEKLIRELWRREKPHLPSKVNYDYLKTLNLEDGFHFEEEEATTEEPTTPFTETEEFVLPESDFEAEFTKAAAEIGDAETEQTATDLEATEPTTDDEAPTEGETATEGGLSDADTEGQQSQGIERSESTFTAYLMR